MKRIVLILTLILLTGSFVFAYSNELRLEGYEWAYNYGITTQTLSNARLDGYVTRQALAKMVVVFSNMLGLKEKNNICNFFDSYEITNDLKPYATKACKLGLMGVNNNIFSPMNFVSKAQFATILSRILRGSQYDGGTPYYYKHANALKSAGIFESTDVLMSSYMMRGDIMYMLKKAYNYKNHSQNININSGEIVAMKMVRYKTDSNGTVESEKYLIDGSFPLIAPTVVTASIIPSNFNEFIKEVLPNTWIHWADLDCGNGKIFNIQTQGGEPTDLLSSASDYCFYDKKGIYPIFLNVVYSDYDKNGNMNNSKEHKFLLKNLTINSEIQIKGINKGVETKNGEIRVKSAPAEIEFNAESVFNDINFLKNIKWDSDNDGNIDKINKSKYTHNYNTSKVYYPKIILPELKDLGNEGDMWYSFPLRIMHTGFPVCEINFDKYNLEFKYIDGTDEYVKETKMKIIDKKTNKTILNDEYEGRFYAQMFSFPFPGSGNYYLEMSFITNTGAEGSCSKEIFVDLNSENNNSPTSLLDVVRGKLVINGNISGYEPLTVQLDASAIRLTDSNDEITSFTRDFGDGQTQQKVTKGIVSHQYHFDYMNNNGIYNPKVTVFTKKGRTFTVYANDSINVKKQIVKLEIYSPTHPLQEARVGDSVNLALDFSGTPKKIVWDFGDGTQTTECEGRSCVEVVRSWNKSGTYLIKVYVEFEDGESAEQTMQFKIR